MRTISLGILGALALTACGRTNTPETSTPDIVGGSTVSPSDAVVKSTVALVTPDGQAFCTGSLIAKRLVLTAAHCLADYTDASLYVAFGTKATPTSLVEARLRVARSFKVNPNYDTHAMDADEATTPPNDTALIKLTEDAPDSYTPATLLTTSDEIRVGETLTLAGFGLTRATHGTSGRLRKVDVKITQLATAAKEIHFGNAPGKSACMGDSGGPAFVTREGMLKLVGITSRGDANCGGEGIYTDARYFTSWVDTTATAL